MTGKWESQPTLLQKALSLLAYPFSKTFGYVSWRFGRPYGVTAEDLKLVVEHAKPGMIILTRTNHQLSNFFIPGYYKHAAMKIFKSKIIEATGDGVARASISKLLNTKDSFVLLKPKFTDELHMMEAARASKLYEGRPYDYAFSARNFSIYCSELIRLSYKDVGVRTNAIVSEAYGKKMLYPNSFMVDGQWEVVLEKREGKYTVKPTEAPKEET
jgi:uncharacterized protein YycO